MHIRFIFRIIFMKISYASRCDNCAYLLSGEFINDKRCFRDLLDRIKSRYLKEILFSSSSGGKNASSLFNSRNDSSVFSMAGEGFTAKGINITMLSRFLSPNRLLKSDKKLCFICIVCMHCTSPKALFVCSLCVLYNKRTSGRLANSDSLTVLVHKS